jgi:hypothetical protein
MNGQFIGTIFHPSISFFINEKNIQNNNLTYLHTVIKNPSITEEDALQNILLDKNLGKTIVLPILDAYKLCTHLVCLKG